MKKSVILALGSALVLAATAFAQTSGVGSGSTSSGGSDAANSGPSTPDDPSKAGSTASGNASTTTEPETAASGSTTEPGSTGTGSGTTASGTSETSSGTASAGESATSPQPGMSDPAMQGYTGSQQPSEEERMRAGLARRTLPYQGRPDLPGAGTGPGGVSQGGGSGVNR